MPAIFTLTETPKQIPNLSELSFALSNPDKIPRKTLTLRPDALTRKDPKKTSLTLRHRTLQARNQNIFAPEGDSRPQKQTKIFEARILDLRRLTNLRRKLTANLKKGGEELPRGIKTIRKSRRSTAAGRAEAIFDDFVERDALS